MVASPSEHGNGPVSHAFMIDPRSGIVHFVSAETARAECAPSWALPPHSWVGITNPKQDRVCGACLAIAKAMREAGAIEAPAELQPDLEGQALDPSDPRPSTRFGRGSPKGPRPIL